MAGTLTFNAADIDSLVRAVRKAKKFRATWEEKFDPDLHIGGVVKFDDEDWPVDANLDPQKLTPKLWLVKDVGIALQGNEVLPKGASPVMIYAKGLSPGDEGCREKANVVMGREECCVSIPVIDFELAVAAGGSVVKLKVTGKSIVVYSP